MRRSTLAHSKTYGWREDEVILLVADEDEGLGHVVRKHREAFHGLGPGGVEAGNVDGEIALQVGDGD
jgi:hypothetical protein